MVVDDLLDEYLQVFGPADLCFNAVSFLIAIPQKVAKIYDMLGDLFDKISVFLSQFQIYERIEQYHSIDPALLRTISELMISFVNICALSMKLVDGGKWEKTKMVLKVTFFDDDSGVKAEMSKLQALVEKQGGIRGTLTLESVLKSEVKLTEVQESLGIASLKLDGLAKSLEGVGDGVERVEQGMGVLIEDAKGRKAEDQKKQQLSIIGEKLGVEDEKLGIKDTSLDTYKSYWNESVPGTGGWLDHLQEYIAWEDRDTSVDPVLCLIGEENFGKSLLTSAIVRKLQNRYRHGDEGSTRTYISYFFFPKGSEKTSERQRSAETALKCISWQIAHDDMLYRKDLTSLCEGDGIDFTSFGCADLWKNLKFDSLKTNVTYFLLFDGVDQLVENKAQQQLLGIFSDLHTSWNSQSPSQLRVLVTGRPGTFESILPLSVHTIQVGQYNRTDVVKYIEKELDAMESLREDYTMTEELRALKKELKDDIQKNLPTKAQGNFSKVQYSLRDISKE